MATTAKIVKDQRKPKFAIRHRNRCRRCGRPRVLEEVRAVSSLLPRARAQRRSRGRD